MFTYIYIYIFYIYVYIYIYTQILMGHNSGTPGYSFSGRVLEAFSLGSAVGAFRDRLLGGGFNKIRARSFGSQNGFFHCIYVYMYICIYVYICRYVYMCIYIYTQIFFFHCLKGFGVFIAFQALGEQPKSTPRLQEPKATKGSQAPSALKRRV